MTGEIMINKRDKQDKRMNITIKVLLIIFLSVLLILSYILLSGYNNRPSHIKLLAVSQLGNKSLVGRTADLYLDIKPGSGQVFMDTFPLTKLDTQISTRFARNIACKESHVDCSKYDFFYIIRASSPIVGGPSASGAIAALTLAKLNGLKIDENVAMTGTINSGALIGPVGGLREKIKAAADSGIKTVIIPDIERFIKESDINLNNVSIKTNNTTNQSGSYNKNNKENKGPDTTYNESSNLTYFNNTIDLVEYGKGLNVKVIPVSDLFQAVYYFTGENISFKYKITENREYDRIMKNIAKELCSRNDDLKRLIDEEKLNQTILRMAESDNKDESNITEKINKVREFVNQQIGKSDNLSIRADEAFNKSHYYSAASYCFGADVKRSSVYVLQENNLKEKLDLVNQSLSRVNEGITKNFTTITQLQTYLIIQERLTETSEYIKKAEKDISNNDTISASQDIAFANERLLSIILWKQFYKMPGKKFNLEVSELRDSCLSSVSQANELYQYVNLILPLNLSFVKEKINRADREASYGNYAVCLYESTKAKAELNLISSTIGVKNNDLGELLDKKLKAAERATAESSEMKIFPIMAYSYYDYAKSLKKYDNASALLYAEYAIELSDMDIYFTPKRESWMNSYILNNINNSIFIEGVITGLYLILLLIILKSISDGIHHSPIRRKTENAIEEEIKKASKKRHEQIKAKIRKHAYIRKSKTKRLKIKHT